jgi:hypothetical protein
MVSMTAGYLQPVEELNELEKPGILLLFSHNPLFGSVLSRLTIILDLHLTS